MVAISSFLDLGGTMFLGYICWRSVEGTVCNIEMWRDFY